MMSEQGRFAVGIFVLWGGLSFLSEFPQTEGLAVALAWSIAVGAAYVYGDRAYASFQKVTG